MKDQYKILAEKYKLVSENFEVSFDVDGYHYHEELDRDKDVIKKFHYVTDPQGKTHEVDWSPYKEMTKDDVRKWINLGMPGRINAGPLNRADLDLIDKRNQRNPVTESSYSNEITDQLVGKTIRVDTNLEHNDLNITAIYDDPHNPNGIVIEVEIPGDKYQFKEGKKVETDAKQPVDKKHKPFKDNPIINKIGDRYKGLSK
jgi:hypothetical protein